MRPDKQLTDHFSLYELTRTDHAEFQEQNRDVTAAQMIKLEVLAHLLEKAREILDAPIIINGAYRCPALNVAVGSSPGSQHLLCEAVDFHVKEIELEQAFRKLWQASKDGLFQFGQLIYEKDDKSEWLHMSLGAPYREADKTGQVLTMNDGKFNLVERIEYA